MREHVLSLANVAFFFNPEVSRSVICLGGVPVRLNAFSSSFLYCYIHTYDGPHGLTLARARFGRPVSLFFSDDMSRRTAGSGRDGSLECMTTAPDD